MLFAVVFMWTSTFAYEWGERGEKWENMKDWAHHEYIMEAVEANDYSLLVEDMQEKISEEKFDEMVSYYNENGELPKMKEQEMTKKRMNDDWTKDEDDGEKIYKKRKFFTTANQSTVERIVQKLDEEKLEKILERIETKIDVIENNDNVDDEKKEMILEYLDWIKEVIETVLAVE